jgi:hypothetical protein
MMVGEPEQALDHLEHLLRVPYYLSPGWLRIDPTFDPLDLHLLREPVTSRRIL